MGWRLSEARKEVPTGATAIVTVGLSPEERTLFVAFAEELEAATGVHVVLCQFVGTAFERLTELRARGCACASLVSSALGEREVLRLLRWFAPPEGLAPVVVLGARSDEEFLTEALAAGACDLLRRHELDIDRLARSTRFAAELARRSYVEERRHESSVARDELLDAIWERSDEALLLVSNDGAIRRHNGAATRLFGRSAESLAATPFSALGWTACEETLGAARELPSELLAELERPGGDRTRVALRSRTLGRRAGSPESLRLVAVRSLAEAKDAAQLLAEARHFAGLGRFLAGAAHDCGNLLTPLIGYCELLLSKLGEDSPLEGYAREIERSARLASELVHRLRDMARQQPVAEGSVEPDRCLVDLAGLLRSLVGRGIEVTEELRAPDAKVPLRKGEVEQIVLNLAANARDAMPLGGRLALRSRREPESSTVAVERWVLELEDSGGGIAPENLERVFHPTFTTKAAGKGTGLGLWVVRSIVEQAGGRVELASELGRGTRVRVEIPCGEDPVRHFPAEIV